MPNAAMITINEAMIILMPRRSPLHIEISCFWSHLCYINIDSSLMYNGQKLSLLNGLQEAFNTVLLYRGRETSIMANIEYQPSYQCRVRGLRCLNYGLQVINLFYIYYLHGS